MDAKCTGALIAQRRKELGLSQAELAGQLHVTDKAVSRWETGRGMPAVDLLEPLATALGLSVSDLLSGRRLSAEELPRESGMQLVDTMKWDVRRLRIGALALLAIVLGIAAVIVGFHWWTSAPGSDRQALARNAVAYFGQKRGYAPDALELVQINRKENYLAALARDPAEDRWTLCIYRQDDLFPDRWHCFGGSSGFYSGAYGSWNSADAYTAIIVYCGCELPEEAAYYTFQHESITYVCPIENRQFLDIFLFYDTDSCVSYNDRLLDENYQVLPPYSPLRPPCTSAERGQ